MPKSDRDQGNVVDLREGSTLHPDRLTTKVFEALTVGLAVCRCRCRGSEVLTVLEDVRDKEAVFWVRLSFVEHIVEVAFAVVREICFDVKLCVSLSENEKESFCGSS